MMRALLATVVVIAIAPACGRVAGLDDVHAVTDAIDAGIDAAPPCTGTLATPPNEGAAHAVEPSAIAWNANPPTSGTHYPDWAAWDRTYSDAIPRGYWVHNLEHGGIVLLYNCTDCQADVDRLTAIMASTPTDDTCTAPVAHRMIVTPDPLLPAGVTFAATAWDFSYTAACVNEPELRAFIAARYGKGPEETHCSVGLYPPM